MIYTLLIFCLLCTTSLSAKDRIDIGFYHIDLAISLDEKMVQGSLICDFTSKEASLRTVQLQLHEAYKVDKIEGAASFKHEGNELNIELDQVLAEGKQHRLKIFYKGVPPTIVNSDGLETGLIYRQHSAAKHPVIASVCHPEGAYLWFPCKESLQDKSDSIYIDISIEDRKVDQVLIDNKTKEESIRSMSVIAVSNGVLEGIKKIGNQKKYLWRHRYSIAPQHVLVAVSNFIKAESTFKGKGYSFPLHFYVLPQNLKKSKSMIRRIPEIMACLTNTFGPYPYRKEGFNVTQVGIPLGLAGIPTQSNVLLEDMKGTNMYKVVHEMASMWFGNYISPKQWQDAWITEALSAYAEGMWQEYKRGLTVYQIILDEKEYFEGGKLLLDQKEDYSKERLNKKGMYAIHMLRGIMTDVYFFETLKAIVAGKRVKQAEDKQLLSTQRFQKICEYYASENIDQNYDYFFEQWIKGTYFPVYKVSYSVSSNNLLKVNVTQKERNTLPNIFRMPIQLHLIMQDGTVRKETVQLNNASQDFEFSLDANLESLQFDPNNWILKDLEYIKQVSNDKYAIDELVFSSKQNRRQLDINFEVPKKQDLQIEIIQKADAMTVKEDKRILLKEYKKLQGPQQYSFELPLALDSRGSFEITIQTKGAKYIKKIRLKRVKAIF
jgi:aminopeptidase N